MRSVNPADPADIVGEVAASGGIDLDRAARRGAEAAALWSAVPAAERGEALRLAADRLEARAAEAADLIRREVGKPVIEARGEVARSVAILRYHAGAALDAEGES